MHLILLLLVAMAAAGKAEPPVPQVPIPPFAVERRDAESTPYDFEVSFKPGPGHDLDQVRAFYVDWAGSRGWRKVSGAEEAWAADEWFSFTGQDGRFVRQRLAHWVDPTNTRSLRLALRHFPEAGDQFAFVIVEPFFLLDSLDANREPPRAESPADWRPGPSRLQFRFVRQAGTETTGLLLAPGGKFYVFSSETFVNDADVESVAVEAEQQKCFVEISFKEGSEERLRVITSSRLGLTVAIVVEGKIVWTAGLGGPLSDAVVIETESCEEAEELAGQIRKPC